MRYAHITFTILCLLYISSQKEVTNAHIEIMNKGILIDSQNYVVYDNNQLSKYYNNTVFLSQLNCRNDNLQIINNTNGKQIIFYYANIPPLNKEDLKIQVSPNQEPIPFIQQYNSSYFVLNLNCSATYNSNSYFNLISISLPNSISFSFLLNCDPDKRHKKFQLGYFLISVINASIMLGVAMHSHVWSIRFKFRQLRFELRWIPFLIFSILGIIAIILFMKFSYNDYNKAFYSYRYIGLVISIPYIFLCLNEIFFLMKKLKTRIYKIVRVCDIISLLFTIIITTLSFFYENWIFYDFIAGCICVGSIKLFHFSSLKNAFISMGIMAGAVTVLTSVLHYTVPLSYNDYAGELSSPLFLQVPDLVSNLYKKCSWLPILDVILPGVMLSYLRAYDQNQSSKCGGVYTISGNLVFVMATAIWIGVESIFPFSVPFSLIAYPILIISIFVISWRRNEWFTLFNGRFQQGYDTIEESFLEQHRKSFGSHVDHDSIQDLLINQTCHQPANQHNSNIS